MKQPSHLVRFPFHASPGDTRHCVAGVVVPAEDGLEQWSVSTPAGPCAPAYCVDCLGALGGAEQVYGAGALRCMQCGSVFLLRAG